MCVTAQLPLAVSDVCHSSTVVSREWCVSQLNCR